MLVTLAGILTTKFVRLLLVVKLHHFFHRFYTVAPNRVRLVIKFVWLSISKFKTGFDFFVFLVFTFVAFVF
jgi:hypothetical protein